MNIGSFVLGLFAWGIPAVLLVRGGKSGERSRKMGDSGQHCCLCCFNLYADFL